MPHNGRSYSVRPSGALPSTAGATGYRIDPRPRTVRAAGTTPWVPLGHTGSHGQSMVIRIAGDEYEPYKLCVYDIFDRTLTGSWGDWTHP